MRNFTQEIPILSAQGAVGNGNVLNVEDFDTVMLEVDTASSANLTMQVQGSIADAEPIWANAQSISNKWDFLQVKDQQNASVLDGDVGFAPAGVDDNRIFEVNVNGMKWINLRVTAYTAGFVTVIAKAFSR